MAKVLPDLMVIGAGASGLAAAMAAAEQGDRVLILEAREQPGKKLLASGNGRCNLMNAGAFRYYGDGAFAEQVLHRMDREKIASLLGRCGILLAREEDRIYPATFQARSVLQGLKTALSLFPVDMRCSVRITDIKKENGLFYAVAGEHIYAAPRVLVACGGLAQKKLGGCMDGYRLLESMGHFCTPLRPALSPLMTDPKSISGLAGIRVRCAVMLCRETRKVHQEEGELLFTEEGISGICAMQMARLITGPGFVAELNLLHRLFGSLHDAEAEMFRRKSRFALLDPSWLLNGMLPDRVSYAVCKQAGLFMRGEIIADLSADEIRRVADTACHYRIDILQPKDLAYAQVTAGGICTDGFSPDTMESRLVPGLYAAGEVLDVDGDCGGYNLMFAFASGALAGLRGRTMKAEETV